MAEVEKAEQQGPLPVVPYLAGVDEGDPHLAGQKCRACGAIFLLERADRFVCSNCTARDQLEPVRLADRGTLHVYSIVHRSFPGVKTPYVSAVVDLEGGGVVKGNLINVEPVPEKIAMGMPVEVVYDIAPQKDRDGNEYMTYYFQPAN
jgi:hypothetical protein